MKNLYKIHRKIFQNFPNNFSNIYKNFENIFVNSSEKNSEVCKSDVEIVRLVGRHTGCQFLDYSLYARVLYGNNQQLLRHDVCVRVRRVDAVQLAFAAHTQRVQRVPVRLA